MVVLLYSVVLVLVVVVVVVVCVKMSCISLLLTVIFFAFLQMHTFEEQIRNQIRSVYVRETGFLQEKSSWGNLVYMMHWPDYSNWVSHIHGIKKNTQTGKCHLQDGYLSSCKGTE